MKNNPSARTRQGGGVGRPPKFAEASRPVTVTLPESTLAQLAAVSADRARAIVKVAAAVAGTREAAGRGVEIVEVLPGAGVILVPETPCLRRIPGLRLAEIAPGRFLLAILPGTPVETLEVALGDLREELTDSELREARVVDELLASLRRLRRARHLTKTELLLVAMPPGRRAGPDSRAADAAGDRES